MQPIFKSITKARCEMNQVLKISDKDFNSSLITILKKDYKRKT